MGFIRPKAATRNCSPATVYHPAADTGFDIFVRTPSTALLNVYLDGNLITEYHQDFEVIDEDTGIFLIVLFESLMRSLPAGDHTITLQLTGVGQIIRTIHIS